jgi:Ca-activated chloride channel family protein
MSAPTAPARRLVFLCMAVAACAAAPVAAVRPASSGSRADDRSAAPSFILTSDEVTDVAAEQVLPLKASHTSIKVSGVVAEVVVTQTWQNKTDRPLEATYVFPASTRAAVHDLTMTIGERVIRAEIQEKQQARKTYAAARDNGQTATLLEQQRPNVFQVAVANILPGEEIDVELTYVELIVPAGGVYEIVAPQVVGPRYGHPASPANSEAWTYKPNPYLAEGEAPFAWSVDVDVRTPLAVASIGSPTHRFSPSYKGKRRVAAHFGLDGGGRGPDRDLVVRFKLQGDAIQTGAMLYRTPRNEENFFLLMMEPPATLPLSAIPPREVVFVVDVSGSMQGFPTDVARGLMKELLAGLREQDRFNLLLFSGGSSLFREQSVPATERNIAAALTFQEANATYGGTELASALDRALALPTSTEVVSRSFVVLTDGYINAERETFQLVRDHVGDANLFAFGVGRGINRYLIEGLARAGRSEPFFALDELEAKRETKRFVDLVARPALTDIDVTFEGIDVFDVVPLDVPDLLAERPLIVFGKYRGPTRGRAVITGRTGEGPFKQTILIRDNDETTTNRALRTLWARARISDISDFTADPEEKKKELIKLGLRYRLATPFTSFVAVDKHKRTSDDSRRVQQPSVHPAGVDPSLAASTAQPSYQRRTVIDFSDNTVEGALTTPSGSYLKHRSRSGSVGQAYGMGGLGVRGSGSGAGGVAKGVVGFGRAGSAKGKRSSKPPPKVRKPAPAPTDVVELDGTSATTDRHRRLVHRFLQRKLKHVEACHAERRYSRPGVHGDIDFEVRFAPDGRIDRILVKKNTLHDEQLTRCMEDRMRRWRIPRNAMQGRSLVVRFPLHFDPLPAEVEP